MTPKSNAEIPPGRRAANEDPPQSEDSRRWLEGVGWEAGGGLPLDVPPLPLKSNTRSYVSGCLLSQQPGPEVSPALRASGKA